MSADECLLLRGKTAEEMEQEEVRHASKVNDVIDATLREIRKRKIKLKPGLKRENYQAIVEAGFNRATLVPAFVLPELALDHQPITLRGMLYRGQAVGLHLDTSHRYYVQTGRVVLKLRRAGILPYSWIVDSTRRRLKPSSWSGLSDFADDAAASYRLDFWSRQDAYVEIFCEKEAMTGIIEPVTEEFDVHLTPIRGQVSETQVWNVAEEWKRIRKPIFAYYLGDHDPAGLGIEACLKSKLQAFTEKEFGWVRLGITAEDLANRELLGFKVKRRSNKGTKLAEGSWRPYLEEHGDRCLEVDALDPQVVRQRVREAILSHVDQREWESLQRIEALERETLKDTLLKFKAA